MKIKIIRKLSFGDRGKEWFYFEDEEFQKNYTKITRGLKAITANNLKILNSFGVEFEIIKK